MVSALAGAAPPMRRIRPFSTTINWLAADVPVSGSMRRPARTAMGWAERAEARERKERSLPLFCMDSHREVVVAEVGEAKSDAALGVEGHGGGAVDAGEHPTGGQAHEIQGTAQRARPDQLTVADEVSFGVDVAFHAADAHALAFGDRLGKVALDDDGIVVGGRRVIAERVHGFPADGLGGQGLAGVEVVHLGVGIHGAALAYETVRGSLSDARDGKVVRDLELVRGGILQPVANLSILFGAMELAERQRGKQQQQVFHGSFLPVIFTGSWSSRSLRKLTWMRPSASVDTMAGDAEPTSS